MSTRHAKEALRPADEECMFNPIIFLVLLSFLLFGVGELACWLWQAGRDAERDV